MDFLPLIIGVIVAIAVGASKNKKPQQGGGSSTPPAHGENFPFPKELREFFNIDDDDEDDEVETAKPDYYSQDAEQQGVGAEQYDQYKEGVAMTSLPQLELTAAHLAMNVPISQRKAGIIVEAPIEVERSIGSQRAAFDFDLRYAVISAEILKPKYNDNI